LNSLGRFSEALQSFEKALDLDKENALASQNKMTAIQNLEKFNKSIHSYDLAIKNNPDVAENYFKKAWLLYKLKKLEEAIGKIF
jgi:tetratricopeptide (TPR) repeat protein